ncbi:MAG TPA: PEP-CTERM sorting domain-containing protein [Pyrinomonadaceae bacterium]|nr:PEP-CTERM sorting domain-containing protein [Pyrinomonadaceae bacterium]
MRRIFLSALFCLFITTSAQADPFVILPNGELAFNTSFTTQGGFTCAFCSGSGTSSITFGSGANTLTLTFIGVNTTILVGGSAVPTVAGQIQVVTTGSGFVFPANSNPNVALVRLNLQVTQSSPTAGTRERAFLSGPGGGTSLVFAPFGSDHIQFPTGPNPFSYDNIVYTFSGFTIPNTNALVDINAELVAVPEPVTLLLLGSGLGMTVLSRRFLKRRG